jgi:hypothetical protein
MGLRSMFVLSAAAIAGTALFSPAATGQQKPADQLVGTWALVSHEAVRADGSKWLTYGANPQGVAMFDAGGHFIITAMRSGRAGYAQGLPWQGTAEENKATAEGTMTYFGTYSIKDGDSAIVIHIEAASFPNWSGADQKREFRISGDQLILTTRSLGTGGYADVTFKRAR